MKTKLNSWRIKFKKLVLLGGLRKASLIRDIVAVEQGLRVEGGTVEMSVGSRVWLGSAGL